jgi:hypothetical protein
VKINNLKEISKEALLEYIRKIPFLEVKEVVLNPTDNDGQPDLVVTLQQEGKVKFFIVEVKNNGEPRYARQAINQLLRYINSSSEYGVFIAPYISPEAAEICREAGMGYVDLAGNSFISFDKIFIDKQGNPNPYSRKRYLKSLYSPKAERILRVLLSSGKMEWKVKELAKEANVSIGLVSNVKKLLEDREWVDAQTIGFSLIEPFSVLREWSENYSIKRNLIRDFYTILSISEFEERLGNVCANENITYGMTGFSGAARLAPAVRYQRAMAYVQVNLENLTELLGIKPVTSGANVTLLEPYDEGLFYGSQDRDGIRVLSPIQIYLDLKNFRGRGEEAAEALLDQVIGDLW